MTKENRTLTVNSLDKNVDITFLGSRIGIEVILAASDPAGMTLCPVGTIYIITTYVSESHARIERSRIYVGAKGQILKSYSRGND